MTYYDELNAKLDRLFAGLVPTQSQMRALINLLDNPDLSNSIDDHATVWNVPPFTVPYALTRDEVNAVRDRVANHLIHPDFCNALFQYHKDATAANAELRTRVIGWNKYREEDKEERDNILSRISEERARILSVIEQRKTNYLFAKRRDDRAGMLRIIQEEAYEIMARADALTEYTDQFQEWAMQWHDQANVIERKSLADKVRVGYITHDQADMTMADMDNSRLAFFREFGWFLRILHSPDPRTYGATHTKIEQLYLEQVKRAYRVRVAYDEMTSVYNRLTEKASPALTEDQKNEIACRLYKLNKLDRTYFIKRGQGDIFLMGMRTPVNHGTIIAYIDGKIAERRSYSDDLTAMVDRIVHRFPLEPDARTRVKIPLNLYFIEEYERSLKGNVANQNALFDQFQACTNVDDVVAVIKKLQIERQREARKVPVFSSEKPAVLSLPKPDQFQPAKLCGLADGSDHEALERHELAAVAVKRLDVRGEPTTEEALARTYNVTMTSTDPRILPTQLKLVTVGVDRGHATLDTTNNGNLKHAIGLLAESGYTEIDITYYRDNDDAEDLIYYGENFGSYAREEAAYIIARVNNMDVETTLATDRCEALEEVANDIKRRPGYHARIVI